MCQHRVCFFKQIIRKKNTMKFSRRFALRVAAVFLTLAASTAFHSACAAPLRIAFRGAGRSDLMLPDERIRIDLSMFLEDLLTREPMFRVVSEARTMSIYRLIESGACEYGTDDIWKIYNRYYPVDVVCNYHPVGRSRARMALGWKCKAFTLTVGTAKGVVSRDFDETDSFALAKELVEMLIKACDIDAATAKRMRGFTEEKRRVFHALYNVPRLVGHYCDNTGETQLKAIMGDLSKTAGDVRVNARVVNAAYEGMCDRRAIGLGSKDKRWTWTRVVNMGLNAMQIILGTEEEDWMKGFVSHKATKSLAEKQLLPLATLLTEDALARSMDNAMSDDSLLELDLDSDSDKSAKEEKTAEKQDARARASLKALAWAQSAKGFKVIMNCAKQKEVLTRRTVAYCLGFYTNKVDFAQTLAAFARDKDALTALYACWSQRRAGLDSPNAAVVARKVIDGKIFNAGIHGFDACEIALSLLADTGDDSDRARFTAYIDDPKVQRRVQAVRGIFARTKTTDADLKLLDDTDHRVTVAGLHEIKGEYLITSKSFKDKVVSYAGDPCEAVADAARTPLAAVRPKGGAELMEFKMRLDNPLVRRRLIDECVARKEPALVITACSNANAAIRAYALKALMKLDPEAAHKEAMRLLSDMHTYARFYATFVLAELARPGDLAALEKAYALEKNRAAKLYLADAVAKAAGRPKPPPQKSVNSIYETGWAISWQCGYNGVHADRELYDGYYTCGLPQKPTPEMIKAHDERKACIFPRPEPIGHPGLIIVDAASADSFWTELDAELTDDIYPYVDGFVYGEESMSLGCWGIWDRAWRIFCEDAKIDPDRVRGDSKKLTEKERLAYVDWGTRMSIRGFNELYDFTKDYWGKLRPGIAVCTYITGSYGLTDAWKDFKFDIGGVYVYDGDHRRMYECVRGMKSVWPDRPVQWLSFGNINIGLGSSSYGKPVTWNTSMPTRPMSRRFEHCYVDSFAVWLAGADTGYFTNYGTVGAETAKGSSAAKGSLGGIPNIYYGSPVLQKAAEAALVGGYEMFKDMEKESKRSSVDISELADEASGGIADLQIEEEGSKDDPIQKKVDAKIEEIKRGFLYMNRLTKNTTAIELGLPRRWPGHKEAFLLGVGAYSNIGMLLPRFDVFKTAEQPTCLPGLEHFKLAAVSGVKTRMDEATRLKWIKWLKETPAVLIVRDGLFSKGVDWPYIDVKRMDGDLKTFWPWENDIAVTNVVKGGGKGGRSEKVERYVPTAGAPVRVVEKDELGATRVIWKGAGFKGCVIFDYTKGKESTESLRGLLTGLFSENNVAFELNDHPGRLCGKTDNGLSVEILSWNSYTTNTAPRGFELLTGAYNPTVTPRFNCAVTAEDYVSPCIAIHGGVFVFSHDNRLKVIEKLPNGVKVEVKGLVRVVTKTGEPAKISGKTLKEIKTDPNLWYIEGEAEEGICTLPPHGGVQCIDWGGAVDEMPPWRILRVKEPTVLTITR